MKEIIPINIHHRAFAFCKYSFAFCLWLGVFLQSKGLVFGVLLFLVLSVILKAKKAPFIFLYTNTIERLWPSKEIMVDQNAIRFAHVVGSVFAGLGLIVLYMGYEWLGWGIIIVLAILKTSGAFGKCGAMKLYSCLNNPKGQCCRFGKGIKERCQ